MVRFPLNSFADHLRAQATRPNPAHRHEGSQTRIDARDDHPRSSPPTVAGCGLSAVSTPKSLGSQRGRQARAQAAGGQMQAAWTHAAGPDGRLEPW